MILFVDDEPFFVSTYKDALEAEGYSVVVKSRLGPAMELFSAESSSIELVITDVMMPSGSLVGSDDLADADLTAGFAFFDWIRQRRPTIPVVILTNKQSSDVDQKFVGAFGCVVAYKPSCSSSKLTKIVGDLIRSVSVL